MAENLLEAPTGLSLRHLSRKLTRSIHSKAVSDLWKRRAKLEDTLRHQWLRNLPGDSPTQPDSYHGHGEWLHCLPGKWDTALLDPVSGWVSVNGRVSFPGHGPEMWTNPPREANNVNTSWIPMDDTQRVAPKACTPDDVTGSGTLSPSLPGKPASPPQQNRPC